MQKVSARISGRAFEFDAAQLEALSRDLEPEPIRTYVVTIGGRRFPPKQVLAAATGLDRGDFISTQARSILQRLGFPVARRQAAVPPTEQPGARRGQADLLRPHRGRWVAVAWDWSEVVAVADTPLEVVAAMRARGRSGTVLGVPLDPTVDIGGWAQ